MPAPEMKKFISNDLGMRRNVLDAAALGDLAKRHPETFMARVQDLIDAGKFGLRGVRDLKGLFRTFFPINVKTEIDLGSGTRAVVDTSAFPLLMGSLVVDEINRAYAEVPTIGQELCRDMDSDKKFAHVVKIVNNVGQELEVKEGNEFPMISAGEQFSVIGHKRKGFQLALSQEVLEENDVGNFLALVDQGGQFAAELIEEQTLSRVYDQNGSATAPGEPYVYRPGGAGTPLYTTSLTAFAQAPSGTRINNNPLASSVNLDAARLVLANMRNTRGRRIGIPMSETVCVVPDALLASILKITRSELEPGVFNEENNWGPKGSFRPSIASSPKIDDITTSAWLYGAPQRQFIRKWKIRLETVSVYSDPMTYAKTREAYRTRVCWDVEIGTNDSVFMIQNLADVTAPAAATTGI